MATIIKPNPLSEPAQRIAQITADYHADSGTVMTEDRVLRWVEYFPEAHRLPVLNEMAHLLGKTYISQKRMADFLAGLARNEKLTQGDPKKFWAATEVLDQQQRGSSQREMVALLQNELTKAEIASRPTGQPDTHSFVYLDDAIFTGSHLLHDLTAWLKDSAPQKASVYVISAFIHAGALYRATNRKSKENLNEVARKAGKTITFEFWRIAALENRLYYLSNSDIFAPQAQPDDEAVAWYVAQLQPEFAAVKEKYNKDAGLKWRDGNQVGGFGTFSSPEARTLLEEQLLITGCQARRRCTWFIQSIRPLGYQNLASLGFGGTLVTYRNCPNNCPLAWWAGDPWYPLLPRRTNTQATVQNLTETIFGPLEL